DMVRPNAVAVLAELRELGITEIALLTGDRAAVANALAGDLGIPDVRAELLPDEKARLVGDRAFVGDGLNDAPALARATVGLAVRAAEFDAAARVRTAGAAGDGWRAGAVAADRSMARTDV